MNEATDRPRPPLVAVSACILHRDPGRPLYRGKALQYLEPMVGHWLAGAGLLPVMVPAPDGSLHAPAIDADDYAARCDALVLEGGADVWPGHYGQVPADPRWRGDRERDRYEFALLEAFSARGKPVLGVCRGLQVINVARGGTLVQDLPTQRPGPIVHRDADAFEHNRHAVRVLAGTALAGAHEAAGATCEALVCSIHHQAIDRLAPGLVVEAVSPEDGVVEAIRASGSPWLAAVQWHPEFHPPGDAAMLDARPLLADFRAAIARSRSGPG